MFCEKCGAEIKDDFEFCSKCGNQIIKNIEKSKRDKKINKKLITIISCIAALALIIAGISFAVNKSDIGNNSIVGSWADEYGNIRYEFYEDGTCIGGGKYYEAAENGTLTFYDSYHYPYNPKYYKVDGNKLYISSQFNFELEDADCYTRQ